MPGRLTRVVFVAVLIAVMASSAGTFCTGAEADFKAGVRLALDESRTLGWAAPEVVDWNNDGWNDVLVGRHSGAMSLHLNRGVGAEGLQFQKVAIIRQDHFRNGGKPVWAWRFNKANCVCPGPGRISPRVLDWDQDGKKDLVIGDGQGAQIRIWRNVGTDVAPEFSTHHVQYLPPDGGVRPYHETVQPCIADWNGDGNRDLLMGRNRGLYVYINEHTDDSPTFDFDRSRLGTKIRNLFPDQRLSPVFTDWDEDGQQDLVVGSQEGEVWFARNVGTATQPKFTAYQRVKAGGQNIIVRSEARIAIADLDGDGQQDLLVGDGNGIVRFYQANQTDAGVSNRPRPVKRPRSARAEVPKVNDPPLVVTPPAKRQAKPIPGKGGNLPVVDITYKSPCVEPATPGVLKLTRTGNLLRPVTVHLTTRLHHHPVVADVHYVPIPSSVTLKAGQETADVLVTPIDDTLVNGRQTLTFRIVPDPAYRLASRLGAATMKFLDDDCPSVGIRAVNDETPNPNGEQRFLVTALPAPRLDTVIAYSIGGTAVGGADYEALPGKVTIAAGETTATITVKPYLQLESGRPKSVVVTLPDQTFTYFTFYRYLTLGQPRTAKVEITPSDTSPAPPKQDVAILNPVEDAAVQKLRREVARLGWIVFTANSGGPTSDLDLFVMRPDGSQLRNITNTPTFDEFAARVSPNGQRMLYRRTTKTKRVSPRKTLPQDVGNVALRTWPAPGSLVVANADGSDPKPVGGDREFAWATWGPNGKQVACLEPQANTALTQKPASCKIVIRDADTLDVIQELPSGGILSHAVWSPDGKWICGPANVQPGQSKWSKGYAYPLGVGKMVSVNIESGKRVSMARFPDWAPGWATDSDGDWFQGGSPQTLHSANNYGISPAYFSMLWCSGLEGEPSELVFGEFRKHIWGGCTSPDEKYAIFVIGGDRWPLQGKMAILRLADAPIARGDSQLFHEVLADYFPNLNQGPVLDLPNISAGFEPHWTLAKLAFDSDKGQ